MNLEGKEFKSAMAECDGGKKLQCAMSQSQYHKFKGIAVRFNMNELKCLKCGLQRVMWQSVMEEKNCDM